jgi:hypothetical protein
LLDERVVKVAKIARQNCNITTLGVLHPPTPTGGTPLI